MKFVPRHLRKTILTAEQIEAEEAKQAAMEHEKREFLTKQTQDIVAEETASRKAAELERLTKSDEAFTFARAGMPDDTDGVDEEKEYEGLYPFPLGLISIMLTCSHRMEIS